MARFLRTGEGAASHFAHECGEQRHVSMLIVATSRTLTKSLFCAIKDNYHRQDVLKPADINS
jgi:hypothetical protein